MDSKPAPRAVSTQVMVTVILFVLAAVAFFFVLLAYSPSNTPKTPTADPTNISTTVDHLLAIGDASRAEALVESMGCIACHRLGGEKVAPQWTQLMSVAATRQPPLTAAEYIYESIVSPTAYIVESYPASMPQDFSTRLSEQQLADILVYLVNGGT